MFQNICDGEDSATVHVWVGGLGVVSEVEVSSNTTSGFWCRQIGCVTVDLQGHLASVVANLGVRVSGAIVKEFAGDDIGGLLGSLGLCR
jgi:hypothetical protein